MAPISFQEWDELRSVKASARRIAVAISQARAKFGDDPSRWPRYMQSWPADLEAEVTLVHDLERVARG